MFEREHEPTSVHGVRDHEPTSFHCSPKGSPVRPRIKAFRADAGSGPTLWEEGGSDDGRLYDEGVESEETSDGSFSGDESAGGKPRR